MALNQELSSSQVRKGQESDKDPCDAVTKFLAEICIVFVQAVVIFIVLIVATGGILGGLIGSIYGAVSAGLGGTIIGGLTGALIGVIGVVLILVCYVCVDENRSRNKKTKYA